MDCRRGFFYLLIAVFLFGKNAAFSQDAMRRLDSLNSELARFEARKKQAPGLKPGDTVKVNILGELAMLHYQNFPDKAAVYAGEALALSEKLKFEDGIAITTNILGVVYDQKSDYPRALEYYRKSLKAKAAIKDRTGEEDTYANIGVVYGKQGQYTEAMDYQLKALAIAKSIRDQYGTAGIYNNIGVLYMSQDNYDEALKNYLESLKILRQIGDPSALGTAYQNVGDISIYKHQPDQALGYYRIGLQKSQEGGNMEAMANNFLGIGKVYFEKQDYDQALANFQSALRISRQIDFALGIADSYIAVGKAYRQKKDFAKAIANTEKGLAMVQKNNELDLQKDAHGLLAQIYSATGNYKQAFLHQTLFKQMTDSIFDIEKEKKFNQLRMQYDMKTMRDSIKAVQDKKNTIAAAQAESQRNTRNFIYIGMSLIVLFLVIVLWQRNKIAIARKQKALEEERNRISRDLHDNLGAQLSTVRMFIGSLRKGKQHEDISGIVDQSISMLDSSISDLRNVMEEMQTPMLTQYGYIAATEALANKINQLHGTTFTLTHHKMEQRPDERTEHQLYRITQELVNNTLKYAAAKSITLDLLRRDDALVLMYEDDGIGFDPKTVKKGNGLGNIETRVKLLGGTVEFDSMPGAGSRTIIEIPVHG